MGRIECGERERGVAGKKSLDSLLVPSDRHTGGEESRELVP